MSTSQGQPDTEQVVRLARLEQQVQLDRGALLAHIGFRIRTAVGGMIFLVVLILSTLGPWFSDNPGAGSAPASGLINHWNLWLMVSGGQGGGDARLPDGAPAGVKIGGAESGLALLVVLALAFTTVMLVWTAMDGRARLALMTSIGAIATLVVEFVLRFVGDADNRGDQGWPHSYDPGGSFALAQWAAAAVAVWALAVMITARRHAPS